MQLPLSDIDIIIVFLPQWKKSQLVVKNGNSITSSILKTTATVIFLVNV